MVPRENVTRLLQGNAGPLGLLLSNPVNEILTITNVKWEISHLKWWVLLHHTVITLGRPSCMSLFDLLLMMTTWVLPEITKILCFHLSYQLACWVYLPRGRNRHSPLLNLMQDSIPVQSSAVQRLLQLSLQLGWWWRLSLPKQHGACFSEEPASCIQ